MGVLGDFLSPEAGQRRRKWLDDKADGVADTLSYYLGPTGLPDRIGAIAQGLQYTDAGDMVEAADASRSLWNDPSLANAARYTAAGTAMMIPALSAKATTELADNSINWLGDEAGGMKLFRGTNNSGERITGGIGEGYLFGSPHEDVARLYGDNVSQFELMDNARILREGTSEFAQLTGRKRGELLRTMRAGENIRDAANDAIARARDAGYDAVEFTSMRDMGVAVLNPAAVKAPNK
jgi:hypothetical protein